MGTTWTYDTTIGKSAAGTTTSRAVGQALLATGSAQLMETSWTPRSDGPPELSSSYVAIGSESVNEKAVLRHGQLLDIKPERPILRLPIRKGASWSWEGHVGKDALRAKTRILSIDSFQGPSETYRNCAHVLTSFSGKGADETFQETWFCPRVGPARVRTNPQSAGDVIDRKLAGFASPHRVKKASRAFAAPSNDDEAAHAATDFTQPRWTIASDTRLQFPPVGNDDLLVTGDGDGQVSTLNALTGEVRWSLRLGGPMVAPILLHRKDVFISSPDKVLLALDADTGRLRWGVELPDLVTVKPKAINGTLVVATDDHSVSALRLRDGARLWTRRTDEVVSTEIAGDEARILVGDHSGLVQCLETSNGHVVWRAELQSPISTGPIVVENHVVFAEGSGTLRSLGLSDGTEEWSASMHANHVVRDIRGNLYASDGKSVSAITAKSGHVLWKTIVPGRSEDPPITKGDELVLQMKDGSLVRVSTSDGTIVGKRRIRGPDGHAVSPATPLSIAGSLAVATLRVGSPWPQTFMLAFGASEPRSRISFTGRAIEDVGTATSPPAKIDDDLFVPTLEGSLKRVWRKDDVRTLLKSKTYIPFAIAGGETLLTQDGKEAVGISKDTGKRLWTFPVGVPRPGSYPTYSEGSFYVPLSGIGLAAIDELTGKPKWAYQSAGAGSTAPLLVDEDVIYAAGGVARLSGATGAVVWKVPELEAFGPLAEAAGKVFCLCASADSALVAFGSDSGEERWRREIDFATGSGPAANDSTVVAADYRGVVQAFNAATGSTRWSVSFRSPSIGQPVIVGDAVVVAEQGITGDLTSHSFRLVALGLNDGRFLGAFEVPGGTVEGTTPFGSSGDSVFVAGGSLIFLLTLGAML